jgi:hypothetical protein
MSLINTTVQPFKTLERFHNGKFVETLQGPPKFQMPA